MDPGMVLLLLLHVVTAAVMPAAAAALGRRAFLLGALAPGAAAVWAGFQVPHVVAGRAVTETLTWVPLLGLEATLRLDALALVMVALVSGIGCLVLVYSAWYFRPGEARIGRLSVVLVAFAGAMLGLVLADNLLILYVFWELTTICSFLLIGHDGTKAAHRAALRALFLTTGFGMFMLLGFVLLGTVAGTYRISELVAGPAPGGGLVQAGLLLVLAGAFAKSAQVPWHSWLPAAMVAPAPVTAYLHAAAMVQAGVYLIARLAPGFADAPLWRPVVLVVGVASLLSGAWWALAQADLKRLLAFGTVSQLGLLVVLAGAGTRTAALAAAAMLLAHGMFKATLFLTVGVLERHAGSYQAGELSGVGRLLPSLYTAAILAGLSMAGLPPALGYVGKEAALEAFAHTGVQQLVAAGIALGSALTVAYTVRLLREGFGSRAGVPATDVTRPPPGLLLPVGLLAVGGIAFGPAAGWVQALAEPYAGTVGQAASEAATSGAATYRLALWHGFTPTLGLSALIVVTGLLVHLGRGQVARLRSAVAALPVPDTGRIEERAGDVVQRVALAVTRRIQVGSLPVYLGVIFGTLLVVPGGALALALPRIAERDDHRWPGLRLWDNPMQAVLAVVVLASAVAAARAHRRLNAVVLLSATGFGIAGLFVVHGAPDVALTHVLVETLLLVMLALVLRRLPESFPEVSRSRTPHAWVIGVLAGLAGAFVSVFLVLAQGVTDRAAVAEAYRERAHEVGGANIVNTILVDFRALDTLGEITVLVVTITGVVGLIRQAKGGRSRLPATEARPPLGPRSVVLESSVRLLMPVVLVFSLYLLLAGHDRPGGGFAGGLVAGMAYVLRYLAGGRVELRTALPAPPVLFIGGGLFLATVTGAAGWLWADALLGSATAELTLPVVGHLTLTSTLLFETGVYLIVFGLILVLLTTLGAQLERDQLALEQAPEQAPERGGE